MEFLFCGLFIVPVKFLIVLSYSIIAYVFIKSYFYFNKIDDFTKMSPFTYKMIWLIVWIWAKLVLFLFNIYYIKEEEIKIDPKKYPKLKVIEDIDVKETIMISNHISFLDFVPYLSKYDIASMGRSNIKKLPLIGWGA